jgi:hypothetical protein
LGRLDRLRLWLSTAFMWVGVRIAPGIVQPVLETIPVVLTKFPEQLAMGRAYGVILIPWSFGPDAKLEVEQLREAAAVAIGNKRLELQSTA